MCPVATAWMKDGRDNVAVKVIQIKLLENKTGLVEYGKGWNYKT